MRTWEGLGGVTVLVRASESAARPAINAYFSNAMEADPAAGMYGITQTRPAAPASLLAIRAAVRDIAEFASGSMDLADFEKRLESAQY